MKKGFGNFKRQWIAEYITKFIELKYRVYGNDKINIYTTIYNKVKYIHLRKENKVWIGPSITPGDR